MVLPATAYVPLGSEFEQGRPLGSRVRFNGEGGTRREWWWQAGPVDSCCCCCTLPTGVGLLAVLSFLGGLYAIFDLGSGGTPMYEQQLAEARKMVADTCVDVSGESSPLCPALVENMIRLEVIGEHTTAFLVEAFIDTISGMIGVWAVAKHNTQGAKLFLWSFLLKYLMALVGVAVIYHRLAQHNLGQYWYVIPLGSIFSIIQFAYYLKVMWSYYVTVKRRNRAAAAAAPESWGSIELDGAHSTVV